METSDLQAEEAKEIDDGNINSTDKSSELISKISGSLEDECDIPENDGVLCDAMKPIHEFSVTRREIFPVKAIEGNLKEDNCSFENAMGLQDLQTEQNKEACEGEKFVCEASNMLNCHLPTTGSSHVQLDNRCIDSGMLSFVSPVLHPPNELTNDKQQTESACSGICENHQIEALLNKRELGNSNESSQVSYAANACVVLAQEVVCYARTEKDDECCYQQQQTATKCCLVSEMSGSHYRKLLADTTESSRSKTKSAVNSNTSIDKPLTTTRPGYNKFSSAFPGIGLDLNSVAPSAKHKTVKRQNLTCRRQLISSSSTASFNTVISDAKHPTTTVASDVAIKETDEQKEESHVSVNVSGSSILVEDIQFPCSSPKKKRWESVIMGESESCKRCSCKKSKCVKLYCECFAAGFYCVEPCNCQDCFNKPIHEDTVLGARSRIESYNPLAFAPNVIRSSGTPNTMEEFSKAPSSALHKRGCNCKKSGCLKKYCVCFQVGAGCSLSCRCEGCKNTFGCKEGPESVVYLETKFIQRNVSDVCSLDSVPGTREENHHSATPEFSMNARY